MKTSAAKPNASAGSSSGDMNSMSNALAAAPREREIASAAAVPSTAESTVVQNATTRLVHAACCIWSASSSARYQRNDSPSGGNLSDCDAVSEVRITIRLGPMRKTTATAVSAMNTRRSDIASQSMVESGFGIGRRHAREQVEQVYDDQDGEHEDHRDRRSERPVVGADR